MDAKGQKQEQANKIMEDHLQMYLTAMKTEAHQDAKECNKHIQVTDQNSSLITLVQEHINFLEIEL